MGRKIVRLVFNGKPSPAELTTHPSRPRTVEDVAHQEEVVKTLQKALHTANVRVFHMCTSTAPRPCPQLPHLLFYGPPGTGKTTTALAISRQLFGYVVACVFE